MTSSLSVMTSRNVPDIHQKHPDSVMTNVMP